MPHRQQGEADLDVADWHLALALGIGLLLGAERERRKGRGPTRGFAGIRTFAFAALLGGIAWRLGEGFALVGAGFISSAVVVAYAISPRRTTDPGMTTEIALVVTYLLGVLAQGEPELASAIAVVAAVVLAAREQLHVAVRDVLSEEELHDALVLAAAAIVILPLIPNEAVDPLEVVNPFAIWRIVVIVMGVSAAGYVAMRLLGPRFGLPASGLASGFVSGIATVASMGSRARKDPTLQRAASAGAVLASVATVAQLALVVGATSAAAARELAPALVAAGLGATAAGSVSLLGALRTPGSADRPSGRAFDVRGAVLFAVTVTAILFLAAGIEELLGESGLMLATGLAGFVDTHSAALSAASLVAAGKVDASAVVAPVLLGLTANSLVKLGVAYTQGGPAFARLVGAGLLVMMAMAWGAFAARAILA